MLFILLFVSFLHIALDTVSAVVLVDLGLYYQEITLFLYILL